MASDAVRLGLVGTGTWSGAIGNAMLKSNRVELVTCFDPVAVKRKALSEKFGCDREKSYEDLLKRDDIDGVHLTTPNAIHAEQAILAARQGKNVFVDKPIADTIADGRRMIEACKKADVVLMVGHHFRRLAGFRKLKELIDEGAIGTPFRWKPTFPRTLGLPSHRKIFAGAEMTPDALPAPS